MGIFYFPCNFVYWRKVPNHETYKKRLLDLIKDNESEFKSHDIVSLGKSTYYAHSLNQRIKEENPDMIKDVVWDTLDEILGVLNSRENTPKVDIKTSIMTNVWFSKYNENSVVSLHEHYSDSNPLTLGNDMYKSSFVIVYIVNDPNKINETEFVQPYTSSNSLHQMREVRFATRRVDDINEGTVLIFPSTLYHEVARMKISGRVILSFNIYSKFM